MPPVADFVIAVLSTAQEGQRRVVTYDRALCGSLCSCKLFFQKYVADYRISSRRVKDRGQTVEVFQIPYDCASASLWNVEKIEGLCAPITRRPCEVGLQLRCKAAAHERIRCATGCGDPVHFLLTLSALVRLKKSYGRDPIRYVS